MVDKKFLFDRLNHHFRPGASGASGNGWMVLRGTVGAFVSFRESGKICITGANAPNAPCDLVEQQTLVTSVLLVVEDALKYQGIRYRVGRAGHFKLNDPDSPAPRYETVVSVHLFC